MNKKRKMIKDWWKWGDPQKLKHLDDYPKLKLWLEEKWDARLRQEFSPPARFEIAPVSEKKKEQIRDIFASITSKRISFKENDRLRYSLGKSYFDIIKICKGSGFDVPDAVISPISHDEVEYILLQASQHEVAIIPFGGGTNVVGALTLQAGLKQPYKVCIYLGLLDKLIELDTTGMTATFQAGIMGPKMESLLNKQGYTLGHFPQSFEYSSLGGWVVTRSAGQESTHYGKIEDLVEGLKVATPIGTVHTPQFTHEAGGVNLMQLFVGSEGSLGIVTEVRVKIRKQPKAHRWVIALLPSFDAGAKVLQSLIQHDVRPSVVRMSDYTETSLFSKLSATTESEGLMDHLKKEVQKMVLKYKNLEQPNLLILRFEEVLASAATQVVKTKELVEQFGGMLLGQEIGENWAHNRFGLPYLRDTLIEHRIFIDTYETIVPWDKVITLHQALHANLRKSSAFGKDKGIFLGHISHIYPVGACLYFTVLTRMHAGNELEQWQEIKQIVTDTIMKHHGAVSHHHGVGSDHQKWYLKYSDPLSLDILRTVKQKLDPKGILNPGKLFHA
jgi:alkyldihydroxyacetonephosphate synthase